MSACVVVTQLISSDVSLLMVGARKDGSGREKGGSFTEMSCGRCWTMTGVKERFEHCTSKNPFPFLFCVSPASSTAESFFLSLLPLLIAARRIPCSFFSSPVFSLSPASAPYVPVCLPPRVLMSSSWNLFPPHLLCSNSLLRLSSPSSFSPWLCVPLRWDTCT